MVETSEKRGFTIVELLIVIVVIAILAAITIVAYNGIQQRAKNTARVNAAKQWQKIITLYATQNPQAPYPITSGHVCLGGNLPTDLDTDPNADCLYTSSLKHSSTIVDNAYASIGSDPNYPTDPIEYVAGSKAVGISIRRTEPLDPSGANIPYYPYLYYFLEGNNQDCVLRPIIVNVTGGVAIDQSATFTKNSGSMTVCFAGLPDPSKM